MYAKISSPVFNQNLYVNNSTPQNTPTATLSAPITDNKIGFAGKNVITTPKELIDATRLIASAIRAQNGRALSSSETHPIVGAISRLKKDLSAEDKTKIREILEGVPKGASVRQAAKSAGIMEI